MTLSGVSRTRGVAGGFVDALDDRADRLARPAGDLGHVDDLPFAGVHDAGDLFVKLAPGLLKALLSGAVSADLRNQGARRHTHIVARHCHASQFAIHDAKPLGV